MLPWILHIEFIAIKISDNYTSKRTITYDIAELHILNFLSFGTPNTVAGLRSASPTFRS